jgi:hypothetical protein
MCHCRRTNYVTKKEFVALVDCFIFSISLIGVSKTAETVPEPEDVPRPCKYEQCGSFLGEAVLKKELHVHVVDSREIARSARARVLWMKGKRIIVNVAVGHVHVMLERLHKSEVGSALIREACLVVQVKSSRDNRVLGLDARVVEPRVGTLVALAPNRPNELYDWMVERKAYTNLTVRALKLERLVLNNQYFVLGGGESVSLSNI